MPAQLIGSLQTYASSDASRVIGRPAGYQTGDLVILSAYNRKRLAEGDWLTPQGFTLLNFSPHNTTSIGQSIHVWAKIGSDISVEPESYTLARATTGLISTMLHCLVFRGVASPLVVEPIASVSAASISPSYDWARLTTTAPDCLVYGLMGSSNSPTPVAQDDGVTIEAGSIRDGTGAVSSISAYHNQDAAGLTLAMGATFGTGTSHKIGTVLAFRNAAAPTVTTKELQLDFYGSALVEQTLGRRVGVPLDFSSGVSIETALGRYSPISFDCGGRSGLEATLGRRSTMPLDFKATPTVQQTLGRRATLLTDFSARSELQAVLTRRARLIADLNNSSSVQQKVTRRASLLASFDATNSTNVQPIKVAALTPSLGGGLHIQQTPTRLTPIALDFDSLASVKTELYSSYFVPPSTSQVAIGLDFTGRTNLTLLQPVPKNVVKLNPRPRLIKLVPRLQKDPAPAPLPQSRNIIV